MFPNLPISTAVSLYQKHIRARVSSASCAKNGAAGYAALKALGKEELAGRIAADYRFAHPSDLEKIVIGWLTVLGRPVDRTHREVKIGRFYVDFKYGEIVIEVNDDTWHTPNQFHGEDRVSHDQGKYAYLRSQGYTVLILAEKAVRSGAGRQTVTDLLSSLEAQEDF